MKSARGHATLLMLLAIIPFACLAFLVGNVCDLDRRAIAVQNIGDTAGVAGGEVLARGANLILANNARLSLLRAVEAVARAARDALEDARRQARACSVHPICAAYEAAIEAIQPAFDAWFEGVELAATARIAEISAENLSALVAFPVAARETVTRLSREAGAAAVAFVPAEDPGTGIPVYPLEPAPISSLCSLLTDGSPSSHPPGSEQVYHPAWGWPHDEGTLEWVRDHYHLDVFFYALAPVGGPMHFAHRMHEQQTDACNDGRIGPALFDGTLTPSIDWVLERMRFVVAVRLPYTPVLGAPRMRDGAETFAVPDDGLLALSQVELGNHTSIDATTGLFDVGLGRGALFHSALARLALGMDGADAAMQRLAERTVAELGSGAARLRH